MKAKISGNYGCMYYGEVFEHGKWVKKTEPRFTKSGARKELKKWSVDNKAVYLEIIGE